MFKRERGGMSNVECRMPNVECGMRAVEWWSGGVVKGPSVIPGPKRAANRNRPRPPTRTRPRFYCLESRCMDMAACGMGDSPPVCERGKTPHGSVPPPESGGLAQQRWVLNPRSAPNTPNVRQKLDRLPIPRANRDALLLGHRGEIAPHCACLAHPWAGFAMAYEDGVDVR